MPTSRLALVPSGMIRKKPTIWCGGVRWPWLLTADQRIAVDNATRGEHLDIAHFDRVLDAKIINQRAKVVRRRS